MSIVENNRFAIGAGKVFICLNDAQARKSSWASSEYIVFFRLLQVARKSLPLSSRQAKLSAERGWPGSVWPGDACPVAALGGTAVALAGECGTQY